jgi:2-dehydro-3-deoxyphosphogluconate aldolase / (4S)-4-hydroxy-2-oxoglutarate aldolase
MIPMSRPLISQRILDGRVIAVVRLGDRTLVRPVCDALIEGGISCLEITMTVPDAMSIIREIAASTPASVLIGAGSVLDADTARRCIDAGARYIVSPVFHPAIMNAAHEGDAIAIPGAFSPTEIQSAHEAGADMVKVFPADNLGRSFFKSILAPMPHLRLIPTGGVTLDNAADWLRAGACAVGIGSALLDPETIARCDYAALAAKARTLMVQVRGYTRGK